MSLKCGKDLRKKVRGGSEREKGEKSEISHLIMDEVLF